MSPVAGPTQAAAGGPVFADRLIVLSRRLTPAPT